MKLIPSSQSGLGGVERGLPGRVRSTEGLGGSGFIERDEVSVGIKDCEFMVSPRRFGKWGVRVNYSVTHTLSEQGFNSLDADSATAGFSYSPITARPKVNAYGATGHNAIRSLIRMNPYETKLGTKKLDTPLDVQRRKDWRCDNKLYGLRHAVYSVFLTTGEKLTRAERSEGIEPRSGEASGRATCYVRRVHRFGSRLLCNI